MKCSMASSVTVEMLKKQKGKTRSATGLTAALNEYDSIVQTIILSQDKSNNRFPAVFAKQFCLPQWLPRNLFIHGYYSTG